MSPGSFLPGAPTSWPSPRLERTRLLPSRVVTVTPRLDWLQALILSMAAVLFPVRRAILGMETSPRLLQTWSNLHHRLLLWLHER